MQKSRPLGVTIIALLTIISGIGFLVSIILIPLGIAFLVMAYGLWKGKGWAWTITLVLSFIGIALGLASIVTGNVVSILPVIINAIIIYYLYRPDVKVFFGKQH
ncbi:MAG: hypothetical protein WA421_01715 [Nitrososphaeraceae archaeon]|jgi:hypothetical protein